MAALDFPSGAIAGDIYTGTNNVVYEFDGVKWIGQTGAGALDLSAVSQDIIPDADNIRKLGSPTHQWQDIFVSTGSIYIGNVKLSNTNGKFLATTVVNPGEEDEQEDPEDSDATSEISGGGGPSDAIINGDNSFAIDNDGNVVFQGSGPGAGVNRGVVWDYGADNGGTNSSIRQDGAGLTVRSYTDDDGNYSSPVNIVVGQDANQKTWSFRGDGSIQLPDKNNTGYQSGYALNGPTLLLGGENDPYSQVIITGPESNESSPSAQRLVIQGQRGYGVWGQGTSGEGGDVYIWGGTGGESEGGGGSGGDVKVRGGQGQNNNGGYVKIEGGDAADWSGSSSTGGYVEISAGDGLYNNANGGDVNIRAGRSNGSGNNGIINLRTGQTSEFEWQFDNGGNLHLPTGGDILDSDGNSVLGGGSTGPTSYNGFLAHYGRMYDNNSDPNGPINKIVIYQDTVSPSSTIDTSTNDDTFTVTGLTGSGVVAMVVAVSNNITATPVTEIRAMAEAIIDNVILDGSGNVNTIDDIKTAFYANTGTLITKISSLKSDLQFLNFNNQFNLSPAFETGKGATFNGLQYNMSTDQVETSGWGQGPGTHEVGDIFVIPGNTIQDANGNFLATPDNDITITLTTAPDGYIGEFTVSGTLPRPAETWPSNYINDGGDDEYDSGNYISTDLGSDISYNDGNSVTGASEFGGGNYVTVYYGGIFAMFAVNAAINWIKTDGGSGFDGDGVADTGALIELSGSAALEESNLVLTDSPFVTDFFGSEVYFTKTSGGSEVDNIDTNVAITRGNNQGLYNPLIENSWNDSGGNGPSNTLWNADGWDNLHDVENRHYSTWNNLGVGVYTFDRELVMKDTENNKYYAIKFLSFQGAGVDGGAFSYVRKLINTEVWFNREDSESDVSSSVDTVSVGVAIARSNGNGIYNSLDEGNWNSDVSPGGTLWNAEGWSDLSNITSRQYLNFYIVTKTNVGKGVLGKEFVMKDTTTGKYYAVKFHHWGIGNDWTYPGFGYSRREIDVNKLNYGITFADGGKQNHALTEQRLGVLPQLRIRSGTTRRYLSVDDIGKHIIVSEPNTTIYVSDCMHQNFPLGATITIVNMSGGTVYINKDNDNEGGSIMGAGTGNVATSWLFEDTGGGNMATLLLVDKTYGGESNNVYWMLSGPGIQVD